MGRKKGIVFWSSLILFFFTALWPSSFSWGRGKTGVLLNCLVITIDTLRADRLLCSGSSGNLTPRLDTLASRGVIFSWAFAHATTTLPSHASIFLGVVPCVHGVHDNANFIVGEEFLTLAEYLKGSGYATGAFVGAYPLDARFGLNQGFEVYDDSYGPQNFEDPVFVERRAEEVVLRALHWLKGRKTPWFLWVHCFDPHYPYQPPSPFDSRFRERPYDGEVAYVDFALGKLFDYLGERNLFETTLVVVTGDHGESLGEHGEKTHGFFAYNSTLWVPLFLCAPGLRPRQVRQPVCHIDIFPTICDILKLKKPPFLQGISLLEFLNQKEPSTRPIYFESLYPYYSRGWAPLKGLIVWPHKFMDSPLAELYDLEVDFDERHNQIDSENLKEFRQRLNQLLKELSLPEGQPAQARAKMDRSTREKLMSLGYLSSSPSLEPKNFGPEDDIKTLLPYHNRATEAMDLAKQGQTGEAVRILQRILEERKNLDVAYTNLAAIYKKLGRIAEALSVLREGMVALPASYEIFLTYMSYCIGAKEYEEAIKTFWEKRLPQAEQDPEIWNSLGVAYASAGELEKAVAAYGRALQLDRDYPSAHINLGTSYLLLFQKSKDEAWAEKAIDSYERAIALEGNNAAAYNGLGAVYKMTGRLDEAISSWREALNLRPDFDHPLYNLGLAYFEKGDRVAALDYLERYKKLYYQGLSPAEQKRLDELIQKCRGKK
ncbi:MAG: sulfatase-like hydrolase/transferase [Candidatus Aminicenantales bacterium]